MHERQQGGQVATASFLGIRERRTLATSHSRTPGLSLLSPSDRRKMFGSFLLVGTSQPVPEVYRKPVPTMPVTNEFTIRLDGRLGTLGRLCQALADQDVNILAFQQFPLEKGKGSVRLVMDNPEKLKRF